jgi:hypothetical protein
MTTIVHKIFRRVFPERPFDFVEESLLPMDFESQC